MNARAWWPLSGISIPHDESNGDAAQHRAALRATGLVPLARPVLHRPAPGVRGRPRPRIEADPGVAYLFDVGRRVLVSDANGFEAWGFVRKVFGNGARLVHEEGPAARKGNRDPASLWADPGGRLGKGETMTPRQEQALEALADNGFPRESANIRRDTSAESIRANARAVRRFKPATLAEVRAHDRAKIALGLIASAFEVDIDEEAS